MLSSVYIENIALISSLSISFDRGFSAFTGETGAGKSIIIDAIGFALGNRADKAIIRKGEQSCTVEALFSDLSDETISKCADFGITPDEDGCLFIRRTLTNDGKGSVKINGRQVPVSILRDVSGFLVNIHGQHHNGELLNPDKHIKILDSFGEISDLLSDYKKLYDEYSEHKKKLSLLEVDEKEKKRRIDLLKYQISEIKKAKLKNGEEEELNIEKNKIRNIEKISKHVSSAYDLLYNESGSVIDNINKALTSIKSVSEIIPNATGYIEQLEDYKYKILDIAELLHENIEAYDENPDMILDKIEGRLDVISKLKMKYGSDISEILNYLESCETELSEIESSDELKSELEEKIQKLMPLLCKSADVLSKKRHESGNKLSMLVMNELEFLDMNGVGFRVDITETELSAGGKDKVEFIVCTNKGEEFKSLSNTASGGELARIMLAIKCVIAEKDSVETMIFDEVDAGVSGKTARKLGYKLLQISSEREVLCVTHSAQIASLSDTHFFVSKAEKDGRTLTSVTELSGEEKINEIARIIAGIGVTESAKKAAKELIEDKTMN